MENIFFILFLLITGYGLKFAKFPDNFAHNLNLFVIYVSLPATILIQIPKIKFDSSFLLPLLTPWIILALSVVFILVFGKNLTRNTRAALLLLIPLGNTSFFGFPIVESVLGHESLPYAIIYDQLGSFLILATYGTFIIAYFQVGSIGVKQILAKVLSFPPFIFLLLAFIFGESPKSAQPYLKMLSQTLTPLAIISVGFSMRLRLGDDKMIFAKAITLKLIIVPLLVLIVFRIFELNNLSANVTFLESAMPTMITAGALAVSAGFAPRLSSALVGYGIIISLITIPILNILYKY